MVEGVEETGLACRTKESGAAGRGTAMLECTRSGCIEQSMGGAQEIKSIAKGSHPSCVRCAEPSQDADALDLDPITAVQAGRGDAASP